MKITRIWATPVNMPLEAPFWWTGALHTGTSKTIVEVETDQSIVGPGEAPSVDVVRGIEAIGERLMGADPLDIAGYVNRCVPPWQFMQNTDDAMIVKTFGAIEIALWDIGGKIWDQPLCQLLGGVVHKENAFTEYFSFQPCVGKVGGEITPEVLVEYCLRMPETHGSTFFEGKLILGDPELEIRTVRLLCETLGPTAMIRLVSNMRWSLTTARCVLREIEPFDVRNYEDAVSTFEEIAALRQHSAAYLERWHWHLVENRRLDHSNDSAAPSRYRRLPLH